MKLKDAFKIAIETRDARMAGRCVDQFREHGWTYNRLRARAQELCPSLTDGEWEDLMAEADALEAAE